MLCVLLLVFNLTFSASNRLIKNVLIVVAMQDEATPIIKLLSLSPITSPDPNLPMKVYAGVYDNLKIKLILNGKDPMYGAQNVGTQPAVLATYLGVNHFHPDLIISIGTAGGIPINGLEVGDIFISNKIYFYSRRLHSPNAKLYGGGGYVSLDTKALIKKMNIKNGTVCSGDSFDESAADKEVINRYNCLVIDMEAAGVAWVAMLTHTPMFAMKGVTNYIGQAGAYEEFKKNYSIVINKLALKTRDVLQYISSQNAS